LNSVKLYSSINTSYSKSHLSFKEEIDISPSADEELQEGDVLVVIGRETDIEKLKEK